MPSKSRWAPPRIQVLEDAPMAARDDHESELWLRRLRADGPDRDAALAELHALLLRAARFEVARRYAGSTHLRGGDQDDLAQQSADDALVAILGKLDSFRGDSRFTTWAYKFALYEAAAKVRRQAWQGREIPLGDETWPLIVERAPAHARAGSRERRAVRGPAGGDRERPDAAPTRGADRDRAQRRPDRRPRRALEHHPRRAVQDSPRFPPEAESRARRHGLSIDEHRSST